MKKLLGALILALSVPCVALAATWDNVSLVDQMCITKASVKAKPDEHTTSCLLKCANSGYGILTGEGAYVKLDEAGNKLALAALKKTAKKDHIRVNVAGDQKGDVIQVASLTIVE